MGNPHIVLFGPRASDDMVRTIGPRWDRAVGAGVNVEFVWPGPVAGELTLRVWERGVGETLACGTGACAVAASARAHGVTGSHVCVHNPGGALDVALEPSGIFLAGPTQKVGDVTVDEAVLAVLVDATGADARLDVGAPEGARPDGVTTEVATRP
jgi:diaminopimelate epimerase